MPSPAWTQSPFTPSSNANLTLWLDAHQGITTDTNGNVSQWNDQSTSAHNLSQGTAGTRPGYTSSDSTYNYQPTLIFNLKVLTGSQVISAQPFTVIAVGASNGGSAQQEFYNDTGATELIWQTVDNAYGMYAGAAIYGTTKTQGTPVALAAIFNGASSSLYTSSSTPVTGSAGTSNPGGTIYVGASDGGGVTNGLVGKIAEFIILSGTASTAIVQQNFRYLAARYALAVS